jgi:DNA polymerase-4
MLHHPKLKGHPVAVGGSVEQRHGIILARNYEARPFGVKVGQALWEARQCCPDLIIVPPDYEKYLRFSRLFRAILYDYSPQVEPFGLDESWVDVTGCMARYGSGERIANEIRERVKFELGITVSVGVSYNKIFAKLGSDIKKPDATTVITEDNFHEVVWPLPAADLLGVGRATQIKLKNYCIATIGDIAKTNPDVLKSWFGKWGLFLYAYANGLDSSPVAEAGNENVVKSVGNSTTCPRDLENDEDAHIVFQNLAESVAERMRELGLMAKTVEISLRSNDLSSFTRQSTLRQPTHISTELCGEALKLLRANYRWNKPLRSIGIRGTNLVPIGAARQLSLFDDEAKRERIERMEYVIDDIRRRFGHFAIERALMRVDPKLGKLNAKDEHVIHPVGYL